MKNKLFTLSEMGINQDQMEQIFENTVSMYEYRVHDGSRITYAFYHDWPNSGIGFLKSAYDMATKVVLTEVVNIDPLCPKKVKYDYRRHDYKLVFNHRNGRITLVCNLRTSIAIKLYHENHKGEMAIKWDWYHGILQNPNEYPTEMIVRKDNPHFRKDLSIEYGQVRLALGDSGLGYSHMVDVKCGHWVATYIYHAERSEWHLGSN